jgi:hypothetical protein
LAIRKSALYNRPTAEQKPAPRPRRRVAQAKPQPVAAPAPPPARRFEVELIQGSQRETLNFTEKKSN